MVLITKTKPRVTTHHKKRHGQHHKRDHHYKKSYWPYLPLGLIVGLGLLLSSFMGSMHKGVLGYATDTNSNSLLLYTNNERVSNALGSLSINGQLTQAAQAKADDMAARDYWSHNTPEGTSPWTFMTNAGYQYQTAGENLAYGFDTSSSTVTAWMNSAGHRANVLNNTYKEVGFGIANIADYQGSGPQTIVVAMYGSQKGAPIAAAPAPPAQPIQQAPTPQPAAPTPVETIPATPPTEEATKPELKPAEQPIATGVSNPAPKDADSKTVSRLELLAGANAQWSMLAVTAIAVVSAAIFFLRHGLFWHRFLVRGERFIIRHKFFDIILVSTAVIGFILTRSAGIIH
ncbi:MAG TPA: CAP domain-containing protein [Candidatus Saccharimonadales bacterium]|nr:CAP domain-containing protein [Candidatus Saccharimonadales bacterium]